MVTERQIREWLRTVLVRHDPPATGLGDDEPSLQWISDPEMEHGLHVVLTNGADFEITVRLTKDEL